jgi:hypothetical protein
MGSTKTIFAILLFHSTVFSARINYTVKKAVELLDITAMSKFFVYLPTWFFPTLLSNVKIRQDVGDRVTTI